MANVSYKRAAGAIPHNRPNENTAIQLRMPSQRAIAKFLDPTYLKTETALLPILLWIDEASQGCSFRLLEKDTLSIPNLLASVDRQTIAIQTQ